MLEPNQIVNQKNKRVLWLCNHNTLMDFEVPLLISLGFEVFVPKVVPLEVIEYSGKVVYTYDNSLTLPDEVLNTLNAVNFYEGNLKPHIVGVLNNYFAQALVVFIPTPLKNITDHFAGNIYYRVFGLDGNRSYSQLLAEWKISYNKPNIFFAECYPFLHEVENPIIQNKTIYLPLGINVSKYHSKIQEKKQKNSSNKKDVLFVCPRIAHHRYYQKLYREVTKYFKDMEITIAGNNPVGYGGDSRIVGFLEDDKFLDLFFQHKVLFYHSREPRHLHYHPIEAIILGVPVIFMSGGILQRLSKDSSLPGMANTYKEAHLKIKRICQGDKDFIEQILESQKNLLKKFLWVFCKETWLSNLPAIIVNYDKPKRIKKIAIILTDCSSDGILASAINVARMLKTGAQKASRQLDIVFACSPSPLYNRKEIAATLKLEDISFREYSWKDVSGEEAETIAKLNLNAIQLMSSPSGKYCFPDDNVCSFTDTDYWLLVSDRIPQQLIPLKPYSIIAYDYLQRYFHFLPNEYNSVLISNSRAAHNIFSATPQTRQDAIAYLGINNDSAKLIPMEFSLYSSNNYDKSEISDKSIPYLLWVTNSALHKNHVNVFKALSHYYNELDGKLRCCISGGYSQVFSPKVPLEKELSGFEHYEHINTSRKIIATEKIQNHLKFYGYTTDAEFDRLIQNARCLFHGNSYDNGSFALVEAAYYGVPSIATRYPATEYMNQRFNLNLLFCDSTDYKDIAHKIKDMELNHQSYKQNLPSREYLEQFSWQNLAQEYYETIMDYLQP